MALRALADIPYDHEPRSNNGLDEQHGAAGSSPGATHRHRAGHTESRATPSGADAFAEAGLPIPGSDSSQRPPSAVLTLTLDSRRIDDLCPGKVLYEQGVYLIEQVRVTRQPLVMLWSDIWFKESLRIAPPRSLLELEADQRLLLQEFLQSHATK